MSIEEVKERDGFWGTYTNNDELKLFIKSEYGIFVADEWALEILPQDIIFVQLVPKPTT